MDLPKEDEEVPSLPFPIFMISATVKRYLLYDSNLIAWLRRTHHILGVLIGTLPQFPQQNVFLGLPLELQPEEVRLLVEKEIAYVVDDFEWHERGMRSITAEQKRSFLARLHEEGKEAARVSDRRKEASKEKTMMKRLQDQKQNQGLRVKEVDEVDDEKPVETNHDEERLFQSTLHSSSGPSPSIQSDQTAPWTITPTTSYPPIPLPQPPKNAAMQLLPVTRPSSYAIFKHLHAKSYFLSPGLRFGCQFLAYPGDPLRFHSHFLAVGLDWEEEFDLLDLVGGGRLGTGVKKGWLIGGLEGEREGKVGASHDVMKKSEEENDMQENDGLLSIDSRIEEDGQNEQGTLIEEESRVRIFCLEWGGM